MQADVEEKEVEEQMGRLLSGEGLEVTLLDVVPDLARPPVVLKKTVSYIVCAVIFNDKEEVLMVQEAKQECYKQWYLPAGRMEEGESIVQALRREVKEEAGFDCQPITLLLIQEQGPQWIRFIFLVKVTGGTLKTPHEADQESLQATWWDRMSPLSLRGRDILPLIDVGLKYRQSAWHPATMPIDMPCQHVAERIILTFTNSQQELWVLLATAPSAHLPAAAAVKTHTVTWAASMVLQQATPSHYHDYDLCTLGVLSVQHAGRQLGKTDGVCLNVLVSMVDDRPQRNEDGERLEPAESAPPPLENPRYRWHRVRDDALRQDILERIKKKTILPANSLY